MGGGAIRGGMNTDVRASIFSEDTKTMDATNNRNREIEKVDRRPSHLQGELDGGVSAVEEVKENLKLRNRTSPTAQDVINITVPINHMRKELETKLEHLTLKLFEEDF